MRVTTRIVFDCTGKVLEHEWFDYSGPMAECKGADTANAQRQQELQMQQQAFNTQQAQLATLNKAFSGYLSGQQGFSPQLLSGMRSQFLNQNSSTFNQAGQQVRSALGARGDTGAVPISGGTTRGLESLYGQQASSQSQGLLGINTQNAQQALSNQFNAGNILSGNAATLTGTQGVAGNAASSALNSYEQALQASFGGQFMNKLGSSLGAGIGGAASAAATGGLGTAVSGIGSGNFGW